MSDFVNAFNFIGDHWSDLLQESCLQTLKLFAAGFLIAALIALPIGIWLGHLHRGAFLAINLSNIGRALPSLAVIAVLLAIVGIGFWNVAFALVILAVPVILTNAYVGVDGVDRDLVEAARGMGMTPWQILTRVEVPIALPLIFAGLRTAALYVMATTPLAAFAGGEGLGNVIANQASYKLEGVIAASILVSALAFLADGIFALLQRYATPRALRGRQIVEKGSAITTT